MKKDDKKSVMAAHQTHGKDTGSAQVQIALLTTQITDLTAHLKIHAKDKHSRRGLLGMVGRRRRLLRSLQQNDAVEYAKLIEKLGLRK